MKMVMLLISLLTLSLSTAQANYGAAGCGLGALVFQDNTSKNEWWAQVLAATTNNVVLGNQTFGITSGTLNCDANPLFELAHVETFIESNENAVANELAQGQGDSITVLSYAFNCHNSMDLAEAMKKNYAKIYSGKLDSPKAVAERLNSIAGSLDSCSAI